MPISASAARKNMVDCQIQTNGVANESILAAFGNIPRELFLPPNVQGIAYNDEDILLGAYGYLLSPMNHARLLSVLAPCRDDVVLNIGDCTGYATAILSSLVTRVVTMNGKNRIAESGRKIWDQLDCDNIIAVDGENTAGCAEQGPYTAIILNGAVSEIPAAILSQLAPRGRLVCVLRRPDQRMGMITVIGRDEKDSYAHQSHFDATAPWVEGFLPAAAFRF